MKDKTFIGVCERQVFRVREAWSVCVDEMMIHYTGRGELNRFMSRKPTPKGSWMFTLAAPIRVIYDLECYRRIKTNC